jgi:integrase
MPRCCICPRGGSGASRTLRNPKPNAKGITPEPRPVEAARLMLFAVVHEILLYCPMRRHNVVHLHLTEDIIRSQGKITAVRIIGDQTNKTKTGSVIDWPVPASVIDMINAWLKVHRPLLAEEGNPYLFPGKGLHARNESEFGSYFSKLVEREVGAEFNMHVARHFAVVRYLQKHPGQYAVMARVLGHKKVDFTIRFYTGLEINAAAVTVNNAVQAEKASTKRAAAAAYRPRRKPAKGKPATVQKAADMREPSDEEGK